MIFLDIQCRLCGRVVEVSNPAEERKNRLCKIEDLTLVDKIQNELYI